jgi:metal-responsive CopG/Arc/MetJ family transcriptional regulator
MILVWSVLLRVIETEKLGITLPKSLLLTIDGKRGDVPRSMHIRRALENYLNSRKKRYLAFLRSAYKSKSLNQSEKEPSKHSQELKDWTI